MPSILNDNPHIGRRDSMPPVALPLTMRQNALAVVLLPNSCPKI
jgi:hypothetical protein